MQHRCPGEPLTIELMKGALQFFLHDVTYEVPPQDMRISLRRMPAEPASRMRLAKVRFVA